MVLVTCWKGIYKGDRFSLIQTLPPSLLPSLDTICCHRLYCLCASGSTHATFLSLIELCAHSILFMPAQ